MEYNPEVLDTYKSNRQEIYPSYSPKILIETHGFPLKHPVRLRSVQFFHLGLHVNHRERDQFHERLMKLDQKLMGLCI